MRKTAIQKRIEIDGCFEAKVDGAVCAEAVETLGHIHVALQQGPLSSPGEAGQVGMPVHQAQIAGPGRIEEAVAIENGEGGPGRCAASQRRREQVRDRGSSASPPAEASQTG